MLHTESLPHQGIYAPLSQAMTSDSDEEIEIHNSNKHRQQQQQQVQQQKRNRRNPPNTLALNTQSTRPLAVSQKTRQQQKQEEQQQKYNFSTHTANGNGHPPTSSYTANMQNTFRSVMLTDMGMNGSELSNFNSDYDADNVAILGNSSSDAKHNEPMSPMRRACFIASILLCVFVVIGFVWLVPCNDERACPAPGDRIKTHNWYNNYTKIELKGGVNIVQGLRSWENNLIFLYRGDTFFPEFRKGNNKRNGIISLIGSSGAVAWYDEMVDEPVAIDCTLLDVDRNGRPDCVVIDEFGELGAINPISGQWHWRFKQRSAFKIDALDFPVILPDLDGDGVLELLIVTGIQLEQRTKAAVQHGQIPPPVSTTNKLALEERNMLRILSGRYGKPIGQGFKIHDCESLRKLQLESIEMVTFSCIRNNTESQRSKTLAELYALITNKSIVDQKLLPASKISQHRHYGQRKEIDSQRNIYSLSGRELVVENRGKCPNDCNVTFVLSEIRNGKLKILRNFTEDGMYGMVPAQWHFKNTKSKMSGFVMKFWKWNRKLPPLVQQPQPQLRVPQQTAPKNYSTTSNVEKTRPNTIKDNATKPTAKQQQQQQNQNQANKTKKYPRKRRAAVEFSGTNKPFDVFEHLIEKRDAYNIQHKNQANLTMRNNNYNNMNMNNYKMQMITETVILVLFIGADTHIENTSQSDIVQFCRNDEPIEDAEIICQPDLNNQENSMLIADLDQDGSQELVSYMSTFVKTSEDPMDWKLLTYVRLLRLQSELPAFYENADKHN